MARTFVKNIKSPRKVSRRVTESFYTDIARIPNYELEEMLTGEREAYSRLPVIADEMDCDWCG